ncbi:unnamed protein product, partial [Polarella glacialis]
QRRADAVLFEKIGDYACGNAATLYPRAVATLLWSFSEVEIRHGVLFYNAPQHLAKSVAAYTTDELCMVGRAYGKFQMAHLPLFHALSAELPHRTLAVLGSAAAVGPGGSKEETEEERQQREDDEEAALQDFRQEPGAVAVGPNKAQPKISSLVGLLEAYARLTIFEEATNRLLCDALVRRTEELAPSLVVKAARACAALSFAHPGIVRLAVICMTENGEELEDEELELLGRALEDLGALGDDGGRLLLHHPKGVEAIAP